MSRGEKKGETGDPLTTVTSWLTDRMKLLIEHARAEATKGDIARCKVMGDALLDPDTLILELGFKPNTRE